MKTRTVAGIVVLAGSIVATTGACEESNPPSTFEIPPSVMPPPEPGGGNGDTAPPAQPAQPGGVETLATFSDAEVMTIVEVVNLGEIAQGQLAQRQATSPAVKTFATRMVDEHGQALQRVQGLIGAQTTAETYRARIARDPTASLMQRHEQLLTNDLETQTGLMFDLAYMTAQITEHAKVLALIDHSLLPSVGGQPQGSVQAGAHGVHPAQVAAGGGGAGGAGGSQAAPGGATPAAPAPGALHGELTTLRAAIASHLVDALRIQLMLRTGGAPGAIPAR